MFVNRLQAEVMALLKNQNPGFLKKPGLYILKFETAWEGCSTRDN
ncbi:hypothetical protein NIES4071_41040 [Calothrix sp. NIES-4071]|nr:hypothetical protein NIES4071_41040 [Calothrix sp. NIES-4071]BAZ58420.1 hypothetical protein NIES4105_40980 [Calothrix sp. NIES-4105]